MDKETGPRFDMRNTCVIGWHGRCACAGSNDDGSSARQDDAVAQQAGHRQGTREPMGFVQKMRPLQPPKAQQDDPKRHRTL